VPLNDVLAALGERGLFHHLSVSRLTDGGYQASFRTGDKSSYRVELGPDPITAILKAVAPHYGQTWADKLGPAFTEADAIKARIDAEAAQEDDEDVLEDVLG